MEEVDDKCFSENETISQLLQCTLQKFKGDPPASITDEARNHSEKNLRDHSVHQNIKILPTKIQSNLSNQRKKEATVENDITLFKEEDFADTSLMSENSNLHSKINSKNHQELRKRLG